MRAGPRSAAAAMATATVEVEEVATGVWYLTGQSHHSVLVEFDEYLALIEAPQSERRTLAGIERARELQPGKPLQYVVNTHHHFDHSAGIRAAATVHDVSMTAICCWKPCSRRERRCTCPMSAATRGTTRCCRLQCCSAKCSKPST